MAKVVTYLFDTMFQGKQKISYGEKVIVVIITAFVLASTLIFVL